MAEEPRVAQALAAVMDELPPIGKEGVAAKEQGGYAYRQIEDITAVTQPLLAKHGVVFVPRVVKRKIKPVTVGNKPWSDTILHVEYTVYGPAGDSIVVGPVVAIGRDGSDKGANKAMTQAFKQMLLQVFCIADPKDDGDRDVHEADAGTGEYEYRTTAGNTRRGPRVLEGWKDIEEQRLAHANLQERSKRLDDDQRAAMSAFRQAHGFGWPLPRDQYNATVNYLAQLLIDAADAEQPSNGPEPPAGGATPATPVEAASGPAAPGNTPPVSEAEARAALDNATELLEVRKKYETQARNMPAPKVRATLTDLNIDYGEQAGIAELRERLVDHWMRQAVEARRYAQANQ